MLLVGRRTIIIIITTTTMLTLRGLRGFDFFPAVVVPPAVGGGAGGKCSLSSAVTSVSS